MKVDTPSQARFAATHWSIILAAQDGNSPGAEAALTRLCEIYWYPIYAFLRRKGNSCHEAEDLTQSFFAHVLRLEWLRNVGPEKGRFRTFVLRCLTNFVTNQPRPPATVPIDFASAEEWYAVEPKHEITPARLFELRWAAAVLDQATARLRNGDTDASGAVRFQKLLPYLTKETAPDTFAAVATELGISPEAARQEVSRNGQERPHYERRSRIFWQGKPTDLRVKQHRHKLTLNRKLKVPLKLGVVRTAQASSNREPPQRHFRSSSRLNNSL